MTTVIRSFLVGKTPDAVTGRKWWQFWKPREHNIGSGVWTLGPFPSEEAARRNGDILNALLRDIEAGKVVPEL